MADTVKEFPFDYYTEEDKNEVRLLLDNGAVLVFLYSRNVLTKNGTELYEDGNKSLRAEAKSGVTFVPECFFSKFLGFTASCDGSLIRNGITLKTTVGKSSYVSSGGEGEFSLATYEKGGHIFYPLIETLKVFGIGARGYNEDKLTVVGNDGIFLALKNNPRLKFACGYMILGEYDAEGLTSEDMTLVKDKWRYILVGDKNSNDLSVPQIAKKLSAINKECKEKLAIMNKTQDSVILFGTEPPSVSGDLLIQYSALEALAKAYATYGSERYCDESLKDDILFGLEWMFLHMYGDAEIEERGWRSAHDYDWWHWFVGGVEPLLAVLVLMEEHLTLSDMERYLKCFRWITTFMRTSPLSHDAMSRIGVCTKAALLLEDREWLLRESVDYNVLLEIRHCGTGPYRDYAQWTHGIPYNMMYGNNNLSRVLYIGSLLSGTPAEFTSPRQYGLFYLARFMFEAALYKGRGFAMFNGRGNSKDEFSSGVNIVKNLIPMIGMFGEDEDRYIKRFIKRSLKDPDFRGRVFAAASICYVSLLNSIITDEAISDDEPYELTHAWFSSDRVAHHKGNYCFALAMQSCRHPNYESINGSNKNGWYTGDGALYLYTDTDTHSFDGVNFFESNNIAYRIPGTTVDRRERCMRSLRVGWKSSRDFVGSMDVDKKYAIACMDYESYHFEGEDTNPDDSGHGGGYPPHENDLVAKKSWFMLDDECVCLGAGINSTMNSDVITVVEHRRLVKDDGVTFGIERVTVEGEVLPTSEYSKEFCGARWLCLEDFAGFVFTEDTRLTVSKYYNNDWREPDNYYIPDPEADKYPLGKPFFEARIEHGKNPKDKGYSYVIIPYATPERLERYSASPDVKIVSNTDKLQAVYEKNVKMLGVVFWTEGECAGISADTPCLVTALVGDGSFKLAVCDPTQKRDSITLTVLGEHRFLTDSDRAEISVSDGNTVIKFDLSDTYGDAVRVVLEK